MCAQKKNINASWNRISSPDTLNSFYCLECAHMKFFFIFQFLSNCCFHSHFTDSEKKTRSFAMANDKSKTLWLVMMNTSHQDENEKNSFFHAYLETLNLISFTLNVRSITCVDSKPMILLFLSRCH